MRVLSYFGDEKFSRKKTIRIGKQPRYYSWSRFV